MDHHIVGFEVTGDAVLKDQFLPLQEGLTVVYGLNGAGKSRLLKGIRAALSGESTDIGVFAVVQTTPDAWESDEYPFSHPRYISKSYAPTLRYAIAEQVVGTTPDIHFPNDVGDFVHALSENQVSTALDDVFQSRLRSTDSELEQEITRNQLFLLNPLGTRNAPRWEAWPAYDSELPAAKAHLAIYEKLLADNNGNWTANDVVEFLDEGPVLPPRWQTFTAMGRRDFLPTRFAPFDAYEEVDPALIRGILLTPSAASLDFGIDLIEPDADPDVSSIELLKYIVGHTSKLAAEEIVNSARPHWLEEIGEPPHPQTRIARAITPHLIAETSRFDQTSGATPGVDIPATHFSDLISERVRQYIKPILKDTPIPVLRLAAAEDRFTRSAAVWEIDTEDPDEPSRWVAPFPPLGLSDMSSAEQKWLCLAIADALYWTKREIERGQVTRPALTFIDEPEAALHRSAESDMAKALTELVANDPRRVMFVATHSPELLDHPSSKLIEIKRNNEALSNEDHQLGAKRPRSTVQPLELKDKESLKALGLNPSDLLRWTKVFLLVEGHHEEIIFEELFRTRLQNARVEVIPLDGAKNLSKTVDSYVLFKYTRAHVIALVDNLQHQMIQESWAEARELGITRSEKEAVDHINHALSSPGANRGSQDEIGFIRSWLVKALESGVDSRLTPHGLGEKDILSYLPVEVFLPTATSWNELWDQHADARKARPDKTPKQFKRWLTAQGNSRPLNDDTILKAVAALDSVPQEFEQLMKRLEAISSEV